MTKMAERYKNKIVHHAGKLGTDETTIIFNDKSQLLFHFSSNPDFQIIGSNDSVAARFKHHVIHFSTMDIIFQFTFWDKSKLSVNTKGIFRNS